MKHEFDLPKNYEAKMRIVKALHDLLADNSFESITIKAICQKADTSRQTFYRLFEDKLSIGNWYWEVQASKYLAEIGRIYTWHEGRLRLAKFCEEEQGFLRHILIHNEEHRALGNYSMRYVESEYRKTLTEINHVALDETLEFQLRFWTYSASLFMREWILDPCGLSSEQIVLLLDTCLPEKLRRAFDDPVLERRAANAAGQKAPAAP